MTDGAWYDAGERVQIASVIKGVPDQRGTRGKLGTIHGSLSIMGWVMVEVDDCEGVIEYALDQIEPIIMLYHEEPGDLFTVPSEYALAHCISADCAMGAGIARQFRERYPFMADWCRQAQVSVGEAVVYAVPCQHTVFNLVTKKRHYDKPTYQTVAWALDDLKRQLKKYGITKLAMPRIASGLDRLEWPRVRAIVKETFADTDIEVLIKVVG